MPGDDLAHVVRPPPVGVDDAVEFRRVVRRIFGRRHIGRQRLRPLRVDDDRPRQVQGMRIVLGEVVGDAREPRVHVGAAEILGGDFFAGRRFHERRTAKKDRPGALDDDRLVGHRGHIGASGGARAHHDGNLGDAFGRHPRLVEEDASEMFLVGKHLRLEGQERAARVDEVDAGQPVIERHSAARAGASSP